MEIKNQPKGPTTYGVALLFTHAYTVPLKHLRASVHSLVLASSLIKGVGTHFVSEYSPC